MGVGLFGFRLQVRHPGFRAEVLNPALVQDPRLSEDLAIRAGGFGYKPQTPNPQP